MRKTGTIYTHATYLQVHKIVQWHVLSLGLPYHLLKARSMPAVFIPDRDQSPSPTLFPLTILRSFFFSLSSSSFPHALFVSFHIPNKKFAHYRLARGERALFKVFKDVALLQIRDSIELSLSLSLSLSLYESLSMRRVRIQSPLFSCFFSFFLFLVSSLGRGLRCFV